MEFLNNISWAWILSVAFYVYIVGVLIFIIMDNRDAASTFSWMLIFVLFPVLGVIAYIFFGRNWRIHSRKKKIFKKHLYGKLVEILRPLRLEESAIIDEMTAGKFQGYKKFIRLLKNFDNSLFTTNNSIKILQNGSTKFPSLEKDLKKAKSFIHMEYFIWRNDKLTNRIKDILIERAKNNVEVRILYDPMGSSMFWIKGRAYHKEMREAGVKIVPFFNSMARSKFTTLNNINHCKIVVIDGQIGYNGGMNMGQEYIDGKPKFESWRDTHVRIEGNAVHILNALFVYSWNEITKESLFEEKYFTIRNKISNPLPIQILSSGPESKEPELRQLYFSMIATSKKHAYIQSPFFIPDSTILEALKLSAMSGVDVRVMITGIADTKIAQWTAFSFFEDLLRAGVKIYLYHAGFLHSKTISVDSLFCTIGTTNMDTRSFQTSHEVNTVIYDPEITQELEKDFVNDIASCKEFTLEDYNNLRPIIKFRNSLSRLLTPLL